MHTKFKFYLKYKNCNLVFRNYLPASALSDSELENRYSNSNNIVTTRLQSKHHSLSKGQAKNL